MPATEKSQEWPEGTGISEQGVFEDRFRTPKELLGRVLALTEMAAADYAGFSARLASSGETRA